MKKSILLINTSQLQPTLPGQLQEAGYEISQAADNKDGITFLKLQYFDLIICGLSSPKDTDQFSPLTCAQEIDPKIGFIFLAQEANLDAATRAFRAGASDFLPAICSFEELHHRLKQCLGKQDLLCQLAIALNTTERQKDMLQREVKNRKKMEAQLKESLSLTKIEQQKTKAVLATLGVGLCIRDDSFTIMYQNTEHQNLFGAHLGEQCFKAFHKRNTPCQNCATIRGWAKQICF